jgi:hypothetical protein
MLPCWVFEPTKTKRKKRATGDATLVGVRTGMLSNTHLENLFTLRDQVDILALRERLGININNLWSVKNSANTLPVNIFDTLRKEEEKSSVTFSFEPSIPVR